jgi:hypothetical protein
LSTARASLANTIEAVNKPAVTISFIAALSIRI